MIRDGIHWLYPEDAIQRIETARQSGIRLIGFDAAFLDPVHTRSSAVDSWNYTSRRLPPVPDPYDHAIKFIRDRADTGLFFDVVLDRPN
jgi:hypothetical protein